MQNNTQREILNPSRKSLFSANYLLNENFKSASLPIPPYTYQYIGRYNELVSYVINRYISSL